jgi:hypothetical protein
MEGERCRVPCPRGDGRLIGTVRLEALDGRLRRGLDTEVHPPWGRQVGRIDMETPADLVLGNEILSEILRGCRPAVRIEGKR